MIICRSRSRSNGCSLLRTYLSTKPISSTTSQILTNSPPPPPPTTVPASPIRSNILRSLSKDILLHRDYSPPHLPSTEIGGFIVEDLPGQKHITLNGNNIKIEASMFDGTATCPETSEIYNHISVVVQVSKEGLSDVMKFVCSAWPRHLEINRVCVLRPEKASTLPYMGPDIRNGTMLEKGFYEFLDARGVNDNLCKLLHLYMMNKSKIELVLWLNRVQSHFKT